MAESTVTPATQELRIATTMTGGVSLAIWMGGVAREMNLLSQASRLREDPDRYATRPEVTAPASQSDRTRLLYRDLLDFLDLTVQIDVLSGTSAGGVNAVLLAHARVMDRDLGGLRELWLEIGALLSLLRDPTDTQVPSLLQGDARMYAALHQQIAALPSFGPNPDPTPPPSTSLFVTATLLDGEVGRFTDSYGTVVQDVDFHGVFTFRDADMAATDKLALAARTSASFPGAFEPSFLPFAQGTPKSGPVPERPPMAGVSNLTRAHWASDGGVLDNEPIGLLLQTVFDQPADRLVRRVLLYVTPTTGPDTDPYAVSTGDDPTKPYGLVEGLMKDMKAIRSQSIAADLAAIQRHNASVVVRADTRLQLAAMARRLRPEPNPDPGVDAGAGAGGGTSPRLLTRGLFDDYAAREGQSVAGQVVDALMRYVATTQIPAAWRTSLEQVDVGDACRAAVVATTTARWTKGLAAGALPTTPAHLAALDLAAFEGAKAVALAVVRLAYGLSTTADQHRRLIDLLAAVHASMRPQRESLGQLVADIATDPSGAGKPLPEVAAMLADRFLDAQVLTLLADTDAGATGSVPPLDAAWAGLESALVSVADWLAGLTGRVPATQAEATVLADGAASDQAAQLGVYLGYLDLQHSPQAVALRLFDLYATQRAMLPSEVAADQRIDLIQVSADTRTSLDPRLSTAHTKLTGVQMDHFGAFFKESWRANDWMWGRLDGAGWLVHVLLDPARLQMVATSRSLNAAGVAAELARLVDGSLGGGAAGVTASVRTLGAGHQTSLELSDVVKELAFLDDATLPRPVSLPTTALWLARAWQLPIAAEELPVLARTVLQPQNEGPRSKPDKEYVSPSERTWATDVMRQLERPGAAPADALPYATVEALLQRNPVPAQTLAGEKGSPLMVRTIAKAAATLTAAVSSIPQIPNVVRPVTAWARATTLSGYRFTTAEARPRWLIGGGFVLLVVGALAAIQHSSVLGWGGLAAVSVGAYLVLFGAWQTSSRLLVAVLGTAMVVGIFALTVPVVRRKLFGTGPDDGGSLGRHVYWLGSSPWHPLVALGLVALVVALLGLLPAKIASMRSAARTARQRQGGSAPPTAAASGGAVGVRQGGDPAGGDHL